MKSSAYDVGIVGAGISGLSVATFVRALRPTARLAVLEQAAEPGGAIASFSESGYLAEWGPHGFLDNCAESRELVRLAGLEDEVATAPLSRFVRYVCLDGRLQCIPQKPLAILRQPLMPWLDKLRIVGDLWRRPLPGEPSVAQWVAHRFGSALLPFADAVFTGTYAGDIERLAIDAVMPGVRELERTHGSVIRGLFGKMRATKKEGREKKGLPAMASFKEGMAVLPRRLAADLHAAEMLAYDSPVREISRQEDGWQLATGQGELSCRQLVLALPVNRCLPLVAAALPGMPPPRAAIPEARILSVLLGFDQRAQIPFGFGYLAPEKEQRFALGALFSSHMFPGRAPAGCQLLEVLVGGRRHPERLELPDAELIEAVYADLSRLMVLPRPVYTAVLRPRAGIPQLEAGYTELLRWRGAVQTAHPNLHLCGFGWKGIGINDMIKEARRIAGAIDAPAAPEAGAEVKGVYF
ncbi:MAG: protoporphyrinogen oxidase [Desulfobulbus sp.]|jgi:oxygen-dependent protoporphyrinogen oxidase|uniref:protoporphyrinogen oxidase n=1 Tax=Desulfobulbus sp. TaxID=895 RepID=UPI00284E817C|nr:protoporphyrinogen oxidase [Desulfobulbus sp.]MDR2551338.1 protoporphyrinogen oxidase [Desulfobulbus sp.]